MELQTDVRGYLESKGLHLKEAGGSEVHLACFYHGEDPGKRGRLYVNTDPNAEILGLHTCMVCGESGAFGKIMRHFGDRLEPDKEDNSEVRLEILRVAAAYYHDQLADFPDVLAYLKGPERGLYLETIVNARLGYASDAFVQDLGDNTEKWVPSRALYLYLRDLGYTTNDILSTGLITENRNKKLVDSLSGMITIPYLVAGNVVAIRGRSWPYTDGDKRPKYKTCGGTGTRLYNTDAMWETDEVCLTEGEFDALIIEQLGYRAVGVPGAKAWQDSWDAYADDKKRLWLVFDRDDAGEKGAQKLVEKFGSKVRRIHLSPKGVKCDPTQWVAQGNTSADFTALLSEAQLGGLLVTVDQAIEEHATVQGQVGIRFGYDLLDLAIAPGLLPSQVCVILAKTGTGKTLFLLNAMQRMLMVPGQEHLKFLFISLEQTRGEWWERARRIHRFYNLDATEADAAAFWRDRLMIVDANRISPQQVHEVVADFEYRMGQLPDVIVLDYLGYWAQSFQGDRYQRTSDAVMSLKALAKDLRRPIITPHQVSRIAKDGEEFASDAARDAGVVEETADFMFTVWSPDNAMSRTEEERQGIINMRIGKSRHGSRGLLLHYNWAPVSLVMVPQGEPQCALARDELLYSGAGYRDDWETVVWRHRTGFKGASQRPDHTYTQISSEKQW